MSVDKSINNTVVLVHIYWFSAPLSTVRVVHNVDDRLRQAFCRGVSFKWILSGFKRTMAVACFAYIVNILHTNETFSQGSNLYVQ